MAVKDKGNGMVELDCPFTNLKIQMKKEDHEHLKKCAEEYHKKLKEMEEGFSFVVE